MKRKIITLCTALFALGIHAQISTPMWENFEGSSLVLENITYEGTGSETMGVEENPQKSGINKSEKCFALTATNQHDWWHKLHIAPAEGEYFMPASDKHVYLHFKMYRTRIGDASEVHVYDDNSIIQKQIAGKILNLILPLMSRQARESAKLSYNPNYNGTVRAPYRKPNIYWMIFS